MKKFFRLVSMLALAGLTFTYTGCTDYSEDINANKERIDNLKTEVDGKLATLSEQLSSVNKTIEELKSADAAAEKSIKALEESAAALKSQLETLEKKHADDKAALEKAFSAEVTKVNAAIEQLKKDYAAADAALKTDLEKQIKAQGDKLTTLEAKHDKDIKALDEAYKAADAELKSQIVANATATSGIQSDSKKINEETIPAARKHAEDLVKALEDKSAETYATKAALTDSTAKVVKLVNAEVVKLTARLESAEGRLTSLEAAQKALEESLNKAKEGYDAQIKAINADIKANKESIAALNTAHAADVKALKDTLAKLDVKLKAAAAAAAQKTADEAVAAAAAAQKTANEAVAAAAEAHAAANAAQATADKALGEVKTLIDALGVYAQKDSLKTRIEQMLDEEIRLAAKDIELAAKDVELAGDIKDLDARVEALKKAANERIDSVITAFTANVAELAAADKKMGEDITKLFNEKFDKSAFADEFTKAYEARFGDDFRAAYEARFSDDFKSAFSTAWTEKFQPSFNTAFETAWKENFQTSFDTALNTVWDSKFKGSFDTNISSYIATALAVEGVIYKEIDRQVGVAKEEIEQAIAEAKTNLEQQIADAKTALETAMAEDKAALEKKITDAQDALDALIKAEAKAREDADAGLQGQIDALTTSIGNLKTELKALIDANTTAIGELKSHVDEEVTRIDGELEKIGLVFDSISSDRIQSVVFVPEHADMSATLYLYTVNGNPVSDEKIVEATFEVYPKSAAKLLSTANATLYAVNVKMTRAAAASEPAEMIEVVPGENGRVTVKAKFDKKVVYNADTTFAVSLRVENEIPVGETDYTTTNSVESAFVGVELANGCDLKDAYVLLDTEKKEFIPSGAGYETEVPWSIEEAESTWNPFVNAEFRIMDGKDTLTISDFAKKHDLDPNVLTPAISSDPKCGPTDAAKEFFNHAEQVTDNKDVKIGEYFITSIKSENVKKDLAKSVGSKTTDEITAKVADFEVFTANTTYKIGEREAEVNLYINKKDLTEKYELPWTYENVCKLTSATGKIAPYAPFDKPLNKDFEKRFAEYYPVFEYAGADDVESVLKEVLKNKVDQKAYDAKGVEVPGLKMELDPYTLFNADLVEIKSIEGYKGCFVEGGTYKFVNTYKDEATKTKVTISTEMVFGVAPTGGKVVVDEMNLPFMIAGEKKYLPVDKLIERTFNEMTVAGQFKDLAEFKTSLNDNLTCGVPDTKTDNATWFDEHVTKADLVSKGTTVGLKVKGWTFFVPFDFQKTYDADGNDVSGKGFESYIRLSGADIQAFGDKFNFETNLVTWYGTEYIFKASGVVTTPDYGLSFYGDKVNKVNGTAKVVGDFLSGTYRVTNDDLSKYFRVVNGNGENPDFTKLIADNDKLKVEYEVLAADDAEKGYENSSTVSLSASGSLNVTEAGVVDENVLDWGDYTSRDIKVKATLLYRGKELTSKELTLYVDDPITPLTVVDKDSEGNIINPEGDVITRPRTPNQNLVVELWRHLDIRSTVEPDLKNLVNVDATTSAGIWYFSDAANKYDVELTYKLTRNNILVDGTNDPLSEEKVKLESDGKLTYVSDAAVQANEVIIPVEVTLTHFYDRANGVFDNHKVTIYVKVPKSE